MAGPSHLFYVRVCVTTRYLVQDDLPLPHLMVNDPLPNAEHAVVPLEAPGAVTARAQILGIRGVSIAVPITSIAACKVEKGRQRSVNEVSGMSPG